MDALLRHQSGLTSKLNTFSSNFHKCSKEKRTRGYLLGRREQLAEYWKQFDDAHSQILELYCEEEHKNLQYFTREFYTNTDAIVFELRGKIEDFLLPFAEAAQTAPAVQQGSVQGDIVNRRPRTEFKLPRLDLSIFSGDYESWSSFHDLYVSAVHSNADIPSVQKLQYLKSRLKGEAELLLRSFQVTDANYCIAWKTLVDRYDNKRVLVTTQLRILFSQHKASESAEQIRKVIDTTNQCITALQNQGINTENWDVILVFLVSQRLPIETLSLWEQSLRTTSCPSFRDLTEFLEQRFRTLECVALPALKIATVPASNKGKATQSCLLAQNNAHSDSSAQYKVCSLDFHPVRLCPTLGSMAVQQRIDIIQEKRLCKNCFSYSHVAFKCSSPRRCAKCNKKHNTMLHIDGNNVSTMVGNSSQANSIQPISPSQANLPSTSSHINSHVSTGLQGITEVLLATALIEVADKAGQWLTFRALLDQGSQGNFITEKAAQRLGLPRHASNISITGVGTAPAPSIKGFINVEIRSKVQPMSLLTVQAYVMSKLTNMHPSQHLQIDNKLINGLQLADPTYGQPGSVDLILSAEIVAEVIQQGMRRISNAGPIAQQSKLGWILYGKVNAKTSTPEAVEINHVSSSVVHYSAPQTFSSAGSVTSSIECFHTSFDSIDRTLKAFYEIEDAGNGNGKLESVENVECERVFKETHCRRPDGRYTVAIPFKSGSHPLLGRSRDIAIARFLQVERRFERDQSFKQRYVESMTNFIAKGFLVPTESTEEECAVQQPGKLSLYRCCYLPHHGVVKEASTTTKLRTVFDASSKTSVGISLNDTMLTGPVLQDTLASLLLRWRKYPIAFKAHITQMYLQICVRDEDADYQRVVWRAEPTDVIKDYKLNTVTFGTASAVRTIHQLSQDEILNFPLGAKIIRNDFYVDDLMSGAETVAEAKTAQSQVIGILKAGGFQIRKWCSNSKEICESVDEQDREICGSVFATVKTLGLEWNPVSDQFFIKTNRQFQAVTSKRTLLSAASSLFDPLGWVAPSVIIPKMILQKLWLAGLTWDEPLPDDIKREWTRFERSLQTLEQVALPRWIGTKSQTVTDTELHGFSDASEKAYGAAIYMRVLQADGSYRVQLLIAKTRVAPLKKVTLPRLELCGALLGAKLMEQVSKIMGIETIHLWTDSQIVLAWVHGHPSKWKSFVANRVSEIQSTVNTAVWHYVPTKDNPADAASRGVYPAELPDCKLWWNGPTWLKQSSEAWPKQQNAVSTNTDLEIKKIYSLVTTQINSTLDEMLNNYSSLSKLFRVTAYCLRWRQKMKKSVNQPEWISVEELQIACKIHLRNVQNNVFASEIIQIQRDGAVDNKSKLKSLFPFVDSEGILRVGGRIQNSTLPYEEQHPIILPKGARFTELVVDQIHRETLHGGPSVMLNQIRKTYWILDARNVIKAHVHKCVICFRYSAQNACQLMGNLPEPRVTASRPFTHTGVDYAGPMEILTRRGRGRRQIIKAYISLFVCLATKAIHLELVGDLSTKAFMSAFSRFTARRGKPAVMYSDCGTNFVGAARQLDSDLNQLIQQSAVKIAAEVAEKGVDWKFIPPAAPHFGGLWEAGVKSTKYHLKRILGTACLTYEEMNTALVEIEGCLNSRPICPMSSDPNDLTSLTPAHFLIGDSIIAPPRPSVLDTRMSRLHHWQRVQLLTEHFWQRWSAEYLSRLQQRPKWMHKKPNLEVGDLVLIRDERVSPSHWPLGRITTVHTGADGLVRAAAVKTTSTHLKRPITKLCRLPSEKIENAIADNNSN